MRVLSIIFIFIISITHAQDDYILALDNYDIRTIEVLSNNNVLAFSGDGNCYLSNDEGESWNAHLLSDSSGYLIPIQASFVNENLGYLTCRYQGDFNNAGMILKTQDGGQTWEEVFNSVDRYPTTIELLSETNGLVSFYEPYSQTGFFFFERFTGDWDNTELIFNNGYDTKELVTSGNSMWIRLDEEELFYHSSDNGDNWNIVEAGDVSQSFNSISFVSDEIGFASGSYYDHLYKTTNHGETWTKLTTNIGPVVEMYDVYFKNESFGIWIGGLDCSDACVLYPKVKHTYDGGTTWIDQDHHYSQEAGRYFSGLTISSSNRVYFYSDGIGVFKSVEELLNITEEEKKLDYHFNNGLLIINQLDINSISVYQMDGRLLLSQLINEETLIDLSSLNSGLYVVTIGDGDTLKSFVLPVLH